MERKVDILNVWKEQGLNDEIFCEALLYEDEQAKADIITSYNETTIIVANNCKQAVQTTATGELTDEFCRKPLQALILEDFNAYLNLPKISECSQLLQEIYDNVCESDASMCHIDEYDWEEFYADRYNEKDIENLKDEIKNYRLGEIITIDADEYKIVGYGDLECSFNDDRNLKKEKDYEL